MSIFAILLTLVALTIDLAFYRYRFRQRHPSRTSRILYWTLCLSTDLSLAALLLLTRLVRDNTTGWMTFSMWLFFFALITVTPRLLLYLFYISRRRYMHALGWLAALACAGLFVWGATSGRHTVRVNRVEIRSERLPEAFDGMRLVQFSDTHIGTMGHPARELAVMRDTIMALRPDAVLFSGDLVNVRYTEIDPQSERVLASIRAPHGVFSVLGNHDVGLYIKDSIALPPRINTERVIELQERAGWQVLVDRTVALVRGTDTITVSGVSFDPALKDFRHSFEVAYPELERVYEGVPQGVYNITVSHLPQLWTNIRSLGRGDLTVAGHVHSMQVKLSVGKRRLSPARLFYRLWSGLYEQDGHLLYINDGFGCVGFPMRLGAYPEITLFILRRS